MAEYIEPLEIIIEQFRKLPGVGKKSAVRMAFGVLGMTPDEADSFAAAIVSARSRIKKCTVCGNISEADLCPVCADPRRDPSVICVVEDTRALMAMERVRDYNGLYHVLGGTISPIDGRGPDDLLRPLGIKVSRLAYGIPVGGDLDYADEMTLLRAIDGRREI